MAVHDDLRVVRERQRQHALRQLDLELVGIEFAELPFQEAQLGVGDDVEVIFHAHARTVVDPRMGARRE